ncbi:hypothetical protein EV182_000367 [Spiromyces aspiralis]|uniref:Uncharacterized protein n=1 Tax=Spiromyces aspiralis TaxID=68401 RepID=A0ACC1HH47_9FUNG|nr:hypothetical protein EV182_000367 [Spiromyces aspiralis]
MQQTQAGQHTPRIAILRRYIDPAKDGWWTPVAPLQRQLHTPHNIALTACGLGVILGFGLCMALLAQSAMVRVLGVFLCYTSLFHMLEYLCVALYNPNNVEMGSFMLNPTYDGHYFKAFVAMVAEYLMEGWLFPTSKSPSLVTVIGAVLALGGQMLRSLAMVTAKSSFNHRVATVRMPTHTLVHTGIYRQVRRFAPIRNVPYERHPSYVGFFLWAIGLQIMLKNPLSLCVVVTLLGSFFRSRVNHEERALLRLFGDEYAEYRSRVPTMVPFIKDPTKVASGGD